MILLNSKKTFQVAIQEFNLLIERHVLLLHRIDHRIDFVAEQVIIVEWRFLCCKICFVKIYSHILKHTLHNNGSNPVDAAIRELLWITLHHVNCLLTANAQVALIFRKFTSVILKEAKVERFIQIAVASAEMNVLAPLSK